MTDWIEHNGGPQPVADDVWVMLDKVGFEAGLAQAWQPSWLNWNKRNTYRILNQHLIDAARKEGLQKGLEAFDGARLAVEGDIQKLIDAASLEGIRLGLEAAHMIVGGLLKDDTTEDHANLIMRAEAKIIFALENPETIARDAADKETAR